jgi:hypothetical protein
MRRGAGVVCRSAVAAPCADDTTVTLKGKHNRITIESIVTGPTHIILYLSMVYMKLTEKATDTPNVKTGSEDLVHLVSVFRFFVGIVS